MYVLTHKGRPVTRLYVQQRHQRVQRRDRRDARRQNTHKERRIRMNGGDSSRCIESVCMFVRDFSISGSKVSSKECVSSKESV